MAIKKLRSKTKRPLLKKVAAIKLISFIKFLGLFLVVMFVLVYIFGYIVDIPYHKRIEQSKYFYDHVYPTWVALSGTPIQEPTSKIGGDFYANYQPYQSGTEMFGSGVKINLPSAWKAKIGMAEEKEYKRITIVLNPDFIKLNPGEYNWGAFNIDFLTKQNSVEDFVKTNYPEYASHLKLIEGTIGNRKSYRTLSDDSSWWKDKPYGWYGREIVLGSKYSYVVSFGNSNLSASEDNGLTRREIFPNIIFE